MRETPIVYFVADEAHDFFGGRPPTGEQVTALYRTRGRRELRTFLRLLWHVKRQMRRRLDEQRAPRRALRQAYDARRRSRKARR